MVVISIEMATVLVPMLFDGDHSMMMAVVTLLTDNITILQTRLACLTIR